MAGASFFGPPDLSHKRLSTLRACITHCRSTPNCHGVSFDRHLIVFLTWGLNMTMTHPYQLVKSTLPYLGTVPFLIYGVHPEETGISAYFTR